MTMENEAYLFDTTMFGGEETSSVYGALSFVGNSLLIPTYAKETIAELKFSATDDSDLTEWLSDPVKSESLFNLLIKVYDDVDKLGITSFFIEKDYSTFIYMMALMATNLNVKVVDADFRNHIDNLYFAYQREYTDGIKRDDLSETVTVFNQRIQHLLQTQKGHQFFTSLLNENERKLSDQISILQMVEKKNNGNYMLDDSFFFLNQLMNIFKEKDVHTVYVSPHTAERFSDAEGRFLGAPEICVNDNSLTKEDFLMVSHLARIIMKISNHYMSKIVETKNIRVFNEIDRYLFVIVWMIMHGGVNNMFINGRSYDLIMDVFMSLKKDVSV